MFKFWRIPAKKEEVFAGRISPDVPDVVYDNRNSLLVQKNGEAMFFLSEDRRLFLALTGIELLALDDVQINTLFELVLETALDGGKIGAGYRRVIRF